MQQTLLCVSCHVAYYHYILMPDIFQEAGLPLWLRPYEVLCTSSYTALIETIPDTVIPWLHVSNLLKIYILCRY